jgi:hypothetical protein
MNRSMTRIVTVAFAIVLAGMSVMTVVAAGNPATAMKGSSYYKVHPMFSNGPSEKVGVQSIDRFGPVGIGIELIQPAFKMRVGNVEEGSPAAATGKLKKGQLIDSINGRVMKDMDPRQILGNIITEAEGRDGVIRLMIRENAAASPQEVVVQIPALGAYGEDWPLDCKKSDRIIRDMAEFIKKSGSNGMGLGHLFLLSTGDEGDLAYVADAMQKIAKANAGKETAGGYPWYIGYGGLSLCEYYLRTGDKAILPTIEAYAEQARRTLYNGSWGQKGGANYNYMAGGHMNAAGVHCVTFLLLAKECGAEVDEFTLQSSLKHFYRYAGHGAVSYGDGLPEPTYTDNGKNGGLAFAMAAAASLTPEGEQSVYAKARDASAMTSFYSTSWLLHGHTGGGIGEIWRGPAMGIVKDKAPKRYREFMNQRAWFLDISRRFDGSFGIVGGGRYDTPSSWAMGMALNYTVPRKHLRIYGAPKTAFCQSYSLPKRLWGTEADERFYSLKAAPVRGGPAHDVDSENLVDDGSWPVLRKLKADGVSDAFLLRYTHHPDFNLRSVYSAGTVRALGRGDLALEMLKSEDPRIRRAGIVSLDKKTLTDEMVTLMLAMVNDPEESWWVVLTALDALGSAPVELLTPHVDRLVYWLEHDEWWLNRAAMVALTKVAVHEDHYQTIFPILGKMVANNTRAVALSPLGGIVRALGEADPKVQAFAVTALGEAYAQFPKMIHVPGGQDMSIGVDHLLRSQAWNLSKIPGGFDELLKVSTGRFPGDALPHKELYLGADETMFGPKVKETLKPVVLEYLIPKYMGEGNHIASNEQLLIEEASSSVPFKGNFYYREPRMVQLLAFYNRIGITDYNWTVFGPDRDQLEWDYHTFDPAEKKVWDPGTRYREVTYPTGMDAWYTPAFDAKAAGWKKGFAPFGQWDGKLITETNGRSYMDRMGVCKNDFCRCDEPMNTLWDKEVLLMRTKIKFPPFEEGHRYRLLLGGMTHVPSGEGFRIYVNGKLMKQRERGIGRREGGKPMAYTIDKAWWPGFEDEVTIAATSFLHNFGGKHHSGVKRQHFSIWLQKAKNPPLKADDFVQGRLMQPMRCTAWQATKDGNDMFQYDGTFVANRAVVGQWTLVDQVADVVSFSPATAPVAVKDALITELTLNEDGSTSDPRFGWSADNLMDTKVRQALKMTTKTIGGTDYLFIEAGGFSKKERSGWKPDHPADWKPALYVMQRK